MGGASGRYLFGGPSTKIDPEDRHGKRENLEEEGNKRKKRALPQRDLQVRKGWKSKKKKSLKHPGDGGHFPKKSARGGLPRKKVLSTDGSKKKSAAMKTKKKRPPEGSLLTREGSAKAWVDARKKSSVQKKPGPIVGPEERPDLRGKKEDG